MQWPGSNPRVIYLNRFLGKALTLKKSFRIFSHVNDLLSTSKANNRARIFLCIGMLNTREKVASDLRIPNTPMSLVHYHMVPADHSLQDDIETKRTTDKFKLGIVFQRTLMPEQ